MTLLTATQRQLLLDNGSPDNRGKDHYPVVKLFTPDAGATWLLTELDPDEPDIAFGLCDLGMGFPELGSVSISELAALRGRLGLAVERDLSFAARCPISVYARAAGLAGQITEDAHLLSLAQADAVIAPAKHQRPQP